MAGQHEGRPAACHSGPDPELSEPFGVEGRAGVDVDRAQGAVARVAEGVRNVDRLTYKVLHS